MLFIKRIFSYSYIIIPLFIIGIYFSFRNSSKITETSDTRIIMGTLVEIKVSDEDSARAKEALRKAFKEIKRIDDIFSTYKKNSQIWKINHSKDEEFMISDELAAFFTSSDSLTKLTKGAFDAGLGSLINLWGFYGESPSIPTKENIKKALVNSGWKNIKISGNKLLRMNNVKIDFGAVAKGYAVDRAIKILKNLGIKDALVNAGGEIMGIGDDWEIGIQNPRNTELYSTKVKLNGFGIATSGDYEKYFYNNGVRYSHIIDGATGYPANKIRSVSIINKNVMFADALSTAVFVLGPTKGMALINKLKYTEGLIIDSKGEKIYSKGFNKFQ